jgi:hypothetical protein
LPANTRGLIVGIDASSFNRIRFPVGGLPIEKGRYNSFLAKGQQTKFVGAVLSSGSTRSFARARFSRAGENESRIIRIKFLERVESEVLGSIEGKTPAAIVSSGENR